MCVLSCVAGVWIAVEERMVPAAIDETHARVREVAKI